MLFYKISKIKGFIPFVCPEKFSAAVFFQINVLIFLDTERALLTHSLLSYEDYIEWYSITAWCTYKTVASDNHLEVQVLVLGSVEKFHFTFIWIHLLIKPFGIEYPCILQIILKF